VQTIEHVLVGGEVAEGGLEITGQALEGAADGLTFGLLTN